MLFIREVEIEETNRLVSGRTKEKKGSKTTLLRREPEEDAPEFQERGREAVAVERVVEEGLDAVDGEGRGGEEVGVGEGGVVEGEVGGGVVGDGDCFGDEEGREAGAAGEEEEVREGEALGDDVIGQTVEGGVAWDEEGGAERKESAVGGGEDGDPGAKGVEDVRSTIIRTTIKMMRFCMIVRKMVFLGKEERIRVFH
ncbi:hypothetical protein V8G54_005572 [Vigna mungo]|uniref:Uncharacterized protein n=1 Tax=Vigna mungo TaxID=3915 RepID=A0AAQ3NZH4_VIGMU